MTLQNVEKIKGVADKSGLKLRKQGPNSYYVTNIKTSKLVTKLKLLTTKTFQNFASYLKQQDTIKNEFLTTKAHSHSIS